MPRIVALFNLKGSADRQSYERWARSTDLPTVRKLDSIDGFTTHRCMSLLGSENAPPYQYVEIIDVNDMAKFGEELSSEVMQRVAAEFQAFADSPCFIVTEDL